MSFFDNPPKCLICGDSTWKRAGDRVLPCECRRAERIERNLEIAGIPARYRDAEFDNYRLDGQQERFAPAHLTASKFADIYPATDERGLLLIGTIGTGKTHLAVALLKKLIRKGLAGRFCDYCSLLREIQSSYRPEAELGELDILAPIMEVEILVLDDVGAMRPSPWVMDTMTLILNTRYSDRRTTIITTNYRDETRGGSTIPIRLEPTLNERIGERVVSRLRELCRFVTMDGPDYRRAAA